MGVPEAFLPRAVENKQLVAYRNFTGQMQAYAADQKAVERGARLLRRYTEKPWLTPGIAVAYTKWEEQFGTGAARDLAGAAFDASQTPGSTRKSTNKELEDFVATKDFQRQVKAFRESQQEGSSWVEDLMDATPVVGSIKAATEGNLGAAAYRGIPGVGAVEVGLRNSDKVPGLGTTLKGVSRTTFTALESPYQEVQALASSGLAHVAQAFEGAARSTVNGQAPSAQPSLINPVNPVDSGLIVGNQSPIGTSSGAIALQHLVQGDEVDLGTGFLPGGEVEKEHTRAVRNIAKFKYGGEYHFATPGRMFAATVTEPGTDPYNVLSGLVDAAAIVKYDPANIALTKFSELNAARKGFSAAEVEAAGGYRSWVRNFVDPPTVDQYLASKTGTRLKDELAAMGPEKFAELGRRTNWSWDVDTMNGVIRATTPEDVEKVLRPALGTTIERQPALHSFAASIRNTTAQHALLSEMPGVRLDLGAASLGGPNGSLKALYNHALGLGLDDTEIATHLYNVASAPGRVARSEQMLEYMAMEKAGLIAKGLPEDTARDLTRFAHEDLFGRARIYTDHEIATGEHIPGITLAGQSYPLDKPYLLSEHLGDHIYVAPLQGKGGRNEALAKYGRILGIPGTSYGDMLDEYGFAKEGLGAALATGSRGVVHGAWRSNAFLTHAQNSLWKPLALIRGAWMVRVLGEEQIRMAMAGYDTIFNHPIRYFAWMGAKKEGELPGAIDWATEMGGLRNSQRGAFGLTDPNQSSYGKITARLTDSFLPDETGHAEVWANKLTQYSEDPMMQRVAGVVHDQTSLDDLKDAFWGGNLTVFRADLAEDPNFLANGIDLGTRQGADTYIDGLYDRLHYYTSGDGELIETVAKGSYRRDIEKLAARRSLKGERLALDGQPVQVVEHTRGAKNATILVDGNAEKVSVSSLTDAAETKILTKNRDGMNLDKAFVGHLASRDDAVKPMQVSGTQNVREGAHADTFVNFMFANMMDRPTTYLSRSQVFVQEYYNQLERLLPHMTPEARAAALKEARGTLKAKSLKGRYDDLVDASLKPTVGNLTHEEATTIAKAHSLDRMRELLYDTHRRNRGLAAIQLLMPFGEAWKEMLGSWARILVEKPQTVRKIQIGVNAARGANPFDYVPGAIPEPMQGRGFFYKDPANGGADNFVYPWSAALNEQLIGVPIPFTAQGQNLSMGFNLLPGVGPVFQMPAMWALDNYLSDPKWDPIRHLVSPYGAGDVEGGFGNQLTSAFLPAYLKKMLTGLPPTNPNAGSGSQSAKALNSTIADIMKYRFSNGEEDPNTPAGIAKAYKNASADARWLYVIQGTFQFGAPAAPRANFLAEAKNGKLVQFDMLRTALSKLYEKDPSTAVAKFIDRYGENAMYVTAPKTLGETLGEQFTKTAVDWERRNPELASKYPLSFALFAPTKKGELFSYEQYFLALGQRETLPAKDAIRRQNNVLGAMWYDTIRSDLGLKPGEAGNTQERAYLSEARQEIHKEYPGWREIAVDPSRIPRAIEEISKAVEDPQLTKSRPALAKAVKKYLGERQWVMDEVARYGGSGDFQNPNFAQAAKWANYRGYLRQVAEEIGQKTPAFLTLWEDTFDREMVED